MFSIHSSALSHRALCWKTCSLCQGRHFGVWSIFFGRWLSTVTFCNLSTKLEKIWASGCHSVTLSFCCWQIGLVIASKFDGLLMPWICRQKGSWWRAFAEGFDGFTENDRLSLKGSTPSGVRGMFYNPVLGSCLRSCCLFARVSTSLHNANANQTPCRRVAIPSVLAEFFAQAANTPRWAPTRWSLSSRRNKSGVSCVTMQRSWTSLVASLVAPIESFFFKERICFFHMFSQAYLFCIGSYGGHVLCQHMSADFKWVNSQAYVIWACLTPCITIYERMHV